MIRARISWEPQLWNEGYTSQGRFWVYRPDYPRVYNRGWALRAHVVWWLHTGAAHPAGTHLHHINGDRLDDQIENLALLDNGSHQRVHRTSTVSLVCRNCLKVFMIPAWRLTQKVRLGRLPKYCTTECYHSARTG